MNYKPVVVFDIETIPDVSTGKRLYPQIADLPDEEALTALIALREQEANSSFMRLPLHKIACLSMFWVDKTGRMKLKSFSLQDFEESEILEHFFNAFKFKEPICLVSWNGRGFDLPVVQYRAMHHRLSSKELFHEGRNNSYLNRYQDNHIDLMDKLSMLGASTRQSLDIISGLCGLAGKQDVDGSQVVGLVQNGEWDRLITYCEGDVLNTWLIYLRWQYLLGNIDDGAYEQQQKNTLEYLQTLKNSEGQWRHQSFLESWDFFNHSLQAQPVIHHQNHQMADDNSSVDENSLLEQNIDNIDEDDDPFIQ